MNRSGAWWGTGRVGGRSADLQGWVGGVGVRGGCGCSGVGGGALVRDGRSGLWKAQYM